MKKITKQQRERRNLLNNLNRQRKKLIENGAFPHEIKKLYNGVDMNTSFSNFDTKKLKEIKKNATFRGGLKVEDGNIYTIEYLRRHNTYKNATNMNIKKVKGNFKHSTIEKIKESNLMKNYYSSSHIKRRIKEHQKSFKNRYAEMVRELDKDLSTKIKRMPYNNFQKMLNSRGGLIDFDEVKKFFYNRSDIDELNDEQESLDNTMLKNIRNAYNTYK